MRYQDLSGSLSAKGGEKIREALTPLPCPDGENDLAFRGGIPGTDSSRGVPSEDGRLEFEPLCTL
jgi:hypothetical protein